MDTFSWWLLGGSLYLILGMFISRYAAQDLRKNPNGTNNGDDFIMVIVMLCWGLIMAYVLLVLMAGGKTSKKGKTDGRQGQAPRAD